MNLLLTGATGFVGRNLLLEILQRGDYQSIFVPVRSIEKLKAQFLGDGFDTIPSKVIPIETSAPRWDLGAAREITHVVHGAGLLFSKKKEDYFKTNVEGTLQLLSQVKGAKKIILLSSQAASGPCLPNQKCKTENDSDQPVTYYGESKLEMEKKVKAQFPELPIVIIRPPMVLGPRDQATLPLFKMVKFPIQIKPGRETKFYSYIGVSDLVEAILKVLQSDKPMAPQSLYFVANENPTSDRELLETAAKASGSAGFIVPLPQSLLKGFTRVLHKLPYLRDMIPNLSPDRSKEIWPNRWVVSSDRFMSQFQWRSKESLEKTLQQTYLWYKQTRQLS
jgi:nucleoside-diphosphate-sugar epimerase